MADVSADASTAIPMKLKIVRSALAGSTRMSSEVDQEKFLVDGRFRSGPEVDVLGPRTERLDVTLDELLHERLE